MRPILVLAGLLPCLDAKPAAHRRDATSPVQARDALCGNNGYDKNNPNAFYVSQNPSDVTSTGCSSLCRRAQNCASFAYGAGYCLLYTAPVIDNLLPSPSSPYLFNDLACVGSADTSAASISSPVVNVSPIPTTPGGSQTCGATTVTVSGPQLPGVVTTVTVSGSQLPGPATTVTLTGSSVTQTLPAVTATSTLTLPAVTKSSTFTLPAATSTLTLPAVTSTLTLPAVTSKTTITNSATVTIRCVGLGIICTTVT